MAEPKTAEEGHDDLKAHTKECDCEACKAGKPSDPEFLEVHKRLAAEWIEEMQNLDISKGSKGFKSNMLPFSRVKKLMKANQEVKMVSAETALLLTKASELFLVELASLSWVGTVQNKRKTLLNVDTHQAILKTDYFDFLVDVIDGTIARENELAKRRRKNQGPELSESNVQAVPQLFQSSSSSSQLYYAGFGPYPNHIYGQPPP